MDLIHVPSPSLTLESITALVPLNQGILFVGAGFDVMPKKLASKGYRVLCNDIDEKPSYSTLDWIKCDVLDLNYDLLTKKYSCLVSRCLCDNSTNNLVKKCIESGKWKNFSYLAIEFCHNPYCYSAGDVEKLGVAIESSELLLKNGYNTMLLNGGKNNLLDLMIIASKYKLMKASELFPDNVKNKDDEIIKESMNNLIKLSNNSSN